jgi:hypothetical protein
MAKALTLAAIAAGLAIASGCATEQQMLDKQQSVAVDTALRRGRFDMNCPTATAEVLSRDFIQPAIQGGPWLDVQGINRLEYTVGIAGCGKRTTLVVMCQEGSSTCFAANPRGDLPQSD